jgi:4-amino-4-deoxy-L-arabinose transferase-like glycosyltransferase
VNLTRTAAPSSRFLLAVILLAVVALRIPRLAGPIEEPHAWRQAETAQYARSFHEDGIDLLHPSVCWLGSHRTLVEEFPLPEALMALGYRMTGGENLVLARLVTLAFFLGAALYLFWLVRLLFDRTVATLALAIFSVLPLGLYYSRGIHVDPAALFFVHAAVFHAVRGYEAGGWKDMIAAALWALPACLIKAPYALPFVIPVGGLVLTRFARGRAMALALAAVPAVLGLVVWRHHSAVVNGGVPDWSFIPGFQADVAKHGPGAADWYFGPLEMRADPAVWNELLRRLRAAVGGWVGMALVALGLAVAPWSARLHGSRAQRFLWGWVAGVTLYVLVFFNLNVMHNYYQLPLLAPAATVVAVGLTLGRRTWERLVPRAAWIGTAALVAIVGLVAFRGVHSTSRYFYGRDLTRLEAGSVARAGTPPGALLIASTSRATRTDDPRLLYCAARYGWSVPLADLSLGLVERLKGVGATHLLVLLDRADPDALAEIEAKYPARGDSLSIRPWRTLLFDLGGGRPGVPL